MRLLFLVFLFVLVLPNTRAQLFITSNNTKMNFPLSQMYYDGFWKSLHSLNGTAVRFGRGDVRGKIAYFVRQTAPLEGVIDSAQKAGAVAALFYRVSTVDQPGSAMYIVDGSDRRRLKIPVFEAVVLRKDHPVFDLPDGYEVRMLPSRNIYFFKGKERFQWVANLVQSFLEMAILTIGFFRVRQFLLFKEIKFTIFSIGPICIILDMIGALLRLAYTCVDPFYTFRMIPDRVAIVLVSVSLPFTITAGMLLSFYWAETLTTTSIEPKGFISKYRIPAGICIAVLFAVEIICGALRATVQGKVPMNPKYISVFVYCFMALLLIIFYLVVTTKVIRRLLKMQNHRAKNTVRIMTIRVAISTFGYFMFMIGFFLYALIKQLPWGINIALNLVFLGQNWAGLLQVIAIRPVRAPSRKTTEATKFSAATNRSRQKNSSAPVSADSYHGSIDTEAQNYTTIDDQTLCADTHNFATHNGEADDEDISQSESETNDLV